LATQSALDAVAATADNAVNQLALTKGNVDLLFAADEALQGELGALAAGTTSQLLGKQDQLTPGTVAGGHQMLQGDVVRAIKGTSPLKTSVDANHVELWLDQSELAATPAITARGRKAVPAFRRRRGGRAPPAAEAQPLRGWWL
jgi:hypothetical protein